MNWKDTQFTETFGTEFPVIQGPFGGKLSSVELTVLVSNAGGLGSFGAQPFSGEEMIRISREIRNQTDKPFNFNLWVKDRDDDIDLFQKEEFEKVIKIFQPYFEETGIEPPSFPLPASPGFEEQAEALLDIKPSVFSFVYGIPSEDILEKCRQLGIKTIGTATTLDEAIAIENAGVDAVVASGSDAGGHRVSFLEQAEKSLVGTFSLVPQVADHVRIPVIAAGGIADARGVKAAFSLGADAVQIGTAFLATKQSGTSNIHRKLLFSEDARYTTLTKVFTGRLSRGIRNRLTEELHEVQHALAPYPLQGKITGKLGAYPANTETHPEFKSFWSGQAAPLLKHHDAQVFMTGLIKELNGMM